MKKSIFLAMVATILVVFSGCQKTPPVPKPLKLSMPMKDIKIYIDDSLEKKKQERVVDAMVNAFNQMGKFKVEKTPGFVDAWTWSDYHADDVCKQPSESAQYGNFTRIGTYNFVFNRHIYLLDGNNGLFSADHRKYYPLKTYKAKKINASSFEITGFSSKREAFDIWMQIKRELDKTLYSKRFGNYSWKYYGANKEYKLNNLISKYLKKTDNGDDWTQSCFIYNIILNPLALEKQKRLIISPTLLKLSLKHSLATELKRKGFKVVDDKKDANTIIITKNIFFGRRDEAGLRSQEIKKIFKDSAVDAMNNSSTVGDFASTGMALSAAGHSTMGGIATGLALLSLFDTSGKDYVSFNYVSIFHNHKNIYTGLLGTKYIIKHRYALCSCSIKSLNHLISLHFVDTFFKSARE